MAKESPAYRDTLEALMEACGTDSPVCCVGPQEIAKLCHVHRNTVTRHPDWFGVVGDTKRATLVSLARALSRGTV